MKAELEHEEKWVVTLTRDGENGDDEDGVWENRVEYGYSVTRVMYPEQITLKLIRDNDRVSPMLIGVLIKKDGTPGKVKGHLLWAEDLPWVMVMVDRFRRDNGLTPELTGVPWR